MLSVLKMRGRGLNYGALERVYPLVKRSRHPSNVCWEDFPYGFVRLKPVRNFGRITVEAENGIQGGWMGEASACRDSLAYPCDGNRPPTNPVERSENTHFCLTFDDIGRHVWTALASKVKKVRSQLRCMSMVGLSPTTLWHSWVHAPSLMLARVSENCSHPRINRLLYQVTTLVHFDLLRAHNISEGVGLMRVWDDPLERTDR